MWRQFDIPSPRQKAMQGGRHGDFMNTIENVQPCSTLINNTGHDRVAEALDSSKNSQVQL